MSSLFPPEGKRGETEFCISDNRDLIPKTLQCHVLKTWSVNNNCKPLLVHMTNVSLKNGATSKSYKTNGDSQLCQCCSWYSRRFRLIHETLLQSLSQASVKQEIWLLITKEFKITFKPCVEASYVSLANSRKIPLYFCFVVHCYAWWNCGV